MLYSKTRFLQVRSTDLERLQGFSAAAKQDKYNNISVYLFYGITEIT